jgi:Transcriptional regulator containing an amidase domain and an AraC-type DNA-binding HTH domain
MADLEELLEENPIVPYIRESDFAVRKPWRSAARRLLDYLFIGVREGVLQVEADGREYRFESGQFCLIQPGSVVVLEGVTDTITPFAHFDMFYRPDRADSFPTKPGQLDLTPYGHLLQPSLLEAFGLSVPVRIEAAQPAKLMDTLIMTVERWQQRDPIMQLRACLSMHELIVTILETYLHSGGSMRAGRDPLKWIVAHFSANLSEPLSLEAMAKRANLSVSRFSVLFKSRYAVTPHRYLLNMRLEHAKELLGNTDLSQEQIAQYCGFSDVHHFSKAFRGTYGLTPGEWRKGFPQAVDPASVK